MSDDPLGSRLWEHMQNAHGFAGWNAEDISEAYGGETLKDIHERDHEPGSDITHGHAKETP